MGFAACHFAVARAARGLGPLAIAVLSEDEGVQIYERHCTNVSEDVL